MFSLSDTPCQSILPNDGKIATKLWLAMGPFQIMLMSIRQTRSLDSRTYIYTLWLFNIAMECHGMPWKISYKWRFLARKIIYKWAIFHGYVKLPEGILGISWDI